MNRRILLGCFEIPGWGGGSTAAYQLFQTMRNNGLTVSYLNLIDAQDADYYRFTFGKDFDNPKHLADVHTCVLNKSSYDEQPKLVRLLQELSPDLLIGEGYIAALLMKQAAPKKKIIFLTTGCQQMKDLIEQNRVKDLITQSKIIERAKSRPEISCRQEKKAVDIADLIITHSDTTMMLHKYFYPFQAGKISPDVLWFGEWIHHEALNFPQFKRPFDQRDIDVLFISSSWSRPEKNYALVKKIAADLKAAKIHIVGEAEERSPHATHHPLTARQEQLFMLMGRAKTVVCPSVFDTAPGILFEASAMGCNLVASKNCGNWMICNRDLLVDPFTFTQFLQKIRLSLSMKFPDHMGFFLGTNSYHSLLETIAVM